MLRRLRNLFTRTIRYSLLLILVCFFLLPVYLLVVTSFKSIGEISIMQMWDMPSHFSLAGFQQAFKRLYPNILNSLLLVIPATLLSTVLGSINGYIFSKWKFKGSDTLFAVVLFGMFIPYQSILIPLVKFLENIGLYGSIPGLILVNVIYGLPVTTLIFRNYYSRVPNVFIESAQVNGADIVDIYRHIFLPLSLPGLAVVVIWQFTNVWNEFLFAVTLTNSPINQPITVALVNLAGSKVVEWNVQMSGALLTALPTIIIYILFGKLFREGLLTTAGTK